jgi:hypothetical protein
MTFVFTKLTTSICIPECIVHIFLTNDQFICGEHPIYVNEEKSILEKLIKKNTIVIMFTTIRYRSVFWASLIRYLLTYYTHLFTAIEVFSCHPCRRPIKYFHNACSLHAIFPNFMNPTPLYEVNKTYNLLQFYYGLSFCHWKNSWVPSTEAYPICILFSLEHKIQNYET